MLKRDFVKYTKMKKSYIQNFVENDEDEPITYDPQNMKIVKKSQIFLEKITSKMVNQNFKLSK